MAYILLLIRLTDNNQSFQEKEPAASSPASTDDMSSKEIKDSQLILIRRNADLNQVCEKNNY